MNQLLQTAPEPGELRATRRAAHLNQTKAAGIVNVTLRTWQNWERGSPQITGANYSFFLLQIDKHPTYQVRYKE